MRRAGHAAVADDMIGSGPDLMEKVECNVPDRGTEVPKELDGAARIVRAERRRGSHPATPRHA